MLKYIKRGDIVINLDNCFYFEKIDESDFSIRFEAGIEEKYIWFDYKDKKQRNIDFDLIINYITSEKNTNFIDLT